MCLAVFRFQTCPSVAGLGRVSPLCRRFSWRHQLREFKSEFRVVAVDMRGYGESDLPLAADSYRPELLLADVKDMVEHLGEQTACGRCAEAVAMATGLTAALFGP